MKKDKFIIERTKIISEMLDNPDENGIYPTSKCFEALDEVFEDLVKLPSTEEAGVIAVGMSEHLTAEEQSFFIAGFQECVKYLVQLH